MNFKNNTETAVTLPSVPPLVKRLSLLSEAFRHELQLIPLIAYAIEEHKATSVSNDALQCLLKKDLTLAYSLLAEEVRDISKKSAAFVSNYEFSSHIQDEVSCAVSWNSSILILDHAEIIKSVCTAVGFPIANIPTAESISQLRKHHTTTKINETATILISPLLRGYSCGVLLPSTLEGSKQIHNYNSKLTVMKKLRVARQANKELQISISSKIGQQTMRFLVRQETPFEPNLAPEG